MKLDRSLLKRTARGSMHAVDPNVRLVTLVFLLLTAGVSTLVMFVTTNPANILETVFVGALNEQTSAEVAQSLFSLADSRSVIAAFLSVLLGLYGMVMTFGYNAYSLKLARGQGGSYRDLTAGFGMTGRVLALNVLLVVFTTLWGLAVMIPTTFASSLIVGVAMLLGGEGAIWLAEVVVVLLVLAAMAFQAFIVLRYAMAAFLLLDQPELGALETIRRSKEMMRGREWAYFKLTLSFLGWYLLQGVLVFLTFLVGIVAVMIAAVATWSYTTVVVGSWVVLIASALAAYPLALWLQPYTGVTYAHFYLSLLSTASSQAQKKQVGGYNGPEQF